MFNPDDGYILLSSPQTVLWILCASLGCTHILTCCWVVHSAMVGCLSVSIASLLLHINISSYSQGSFDGGQQNYGSRYTNNVKLLYQKRNSLSWSPSSSTTVQLQQKNCFFCPSLTERHQALLATCGLKSSVCHQQISESGGLWHDWEVTAAAAGEWASQYVSAPWLRRLILVH